jgi:PKD repeat protein
MKISYVGSGNRAPTADASSDVSSGRSPLNVSFDASDSTDPDGDALTYTWNFDDGSSSTGRNVTHTFTANGTYDVLLTVRDEDGATDTDTLRITVGNRAPAASISLSPGTYRAGDTISFTGTGADPEEGNLPASAFQWRVVFHHKDHTHPFIDSIADLNTGQFTIPVTGEPDPDQFYRVHLTVTDSDGLSSTKVMDIAPRTSTVTLATNIPGLKINLDGTPQNPGTSILAVEGMRRTLEAPASQTIKGRTYEFVSWSDKGNREHNIHVPTADATYTANYRQVKAPLKRGLNATYFDNRDFTGRSVTRIDPKINFKWGTGSPIRGIGGNSFSVRWTGQLQVPKSGKWNFHALTDDGARLFINGKPIINHLTKQRATERSASVKLQAGKKYDLRLDYFEASGEALAQLRWNGPGTKKQLIPSNWLFAK